MNTNSKYTIPILLVSGTVIASLIYYWKLKYNTTPIKNEKNKINITLNQSSNSNTSNNNNDIKEDKKKRNEEKSDNVDSIYNISPKTDNDLPPRPAIIAAPPPPAYKKTIIIEGMILYYIKYNIRIK